VKVSWSVVAVAVFRDFLKPTAVLSRRHTHQEARKTN